MDSRWFLSYTVTNSQGGYIFPRIIPYPEVIR